MKKIKLILLILNEEVRGLRPCWVEYEQTNTKLIVYSIKDAASYKPRCYNIPKCELDNDIPKMISDTLKPQLTEAKKSIKRK